MQNEFDALLDKYNNGVEPLSNWTTPDLVRLIDAVDAELQDRAPPDAETNYSLPWSVQEERKHGDQEE